jgi:predicted nucleotidyltransferase
LDEVHSVFGFGSFFRDERFRDVDVLIVLKPTCSALLESCYKLRTKFDVCSFEMGVSFDLLVLTVEEFEERPLREMDSLTEIYRVVAVDEV